MAEEAPKQELSAEDQQRELQGRVEEFNKELLPLLGKYELGLGATAFITPQGQIAARPIVLDARGQVAPQEEKAEPAAATAA